MTGLGILKNTNPTAPVAPAVLIPLGTASFALPLVTNFIITFLIVGRIYYIGYGSTLFRKRDRTHEVTHAGTVAAADEWDDSMQVMRVMPSREDSYERVFHETEIPRFFVDLRGRKAVEDENSEEGKLMAVLKKPREWV